MVTQHYADDNFAASWCWCCRWYYSIMLRQPVKSHHSWLCITMTLSQVVVSVSYSFWLLLCLAWEGGTYKIGVWHISNYCKWTQATKSKIRVSVSWQMPETAKPSLIYCMWWVNLHRIMAHRMKQCCSESCLVPEVTVSAFVLEHLSSKYLVLEA